MEMKHYNVSLVEVIQGLKSRYRDYVIAAVQRQQGFTPLPFPNQSWEFDHIPYMEALLKEIFNQSALSTMTVGQQSPATQMLMRAGVDHQYATWMTAEAFKGVIDVLVTFVPDIEFGNPDAFQYGLHSVYDLMVTEMPVYQD